ncbi:hypothetical protein [Longivirga aurantiaca]|uniref:TfoX N-terminal domain-containing protein n=1 Tax=Longivirga aurantiaca TaxID=1837743 RepID=A0ABW1T1L0_9ACTN
MTPPSAAARLLFDGLATELRGDGVSIGMAFGHRALKHSGLGVACLAGDSMVFRLPVASPEHAEALAVEGAHTWAPSTMNAALPDWVVVPVESSARWLPWARVAVSAAAG